MRQSYLPKGEASGGSGSTLFGVVTCFLLMENTSSVLQLHFLIFSIEYSSQDEAIFGWFYSWLFFA
jgi:hypothetical protein